MTKRWIVERVLLVPDDFQNVSLNIKPEPYQPMRYQPIIVWGIHTGISKEMYVPLSPLSENVLERGQVLKPENEFSILLERETSLKRVRILRSKAQKSGSTRTFPQGDPGLGEFGRVVLVVGALTMPREIYQVPDTPIDSGAARRQVQRITQNRFSVLKTSLQSISIRILRMGRGRKLAVMTKESGLTTSSSKSTEVFVCNNCGTAHDLAEIEDIRNYNCNGCELGGSFSRQLLQMS